MTDEHTFTADQAAAATTALRMLLGKPPEQFVVSQFIAMISDEIEQLREAGHTDADIAALVQEATGGPLSADDIARHYPQPAERGRAGSR